MSSTLEAVIWNPAKQITREAAMKFHRMRKLKMLFTSSLRL